MIIHINSNIIKANAKRNRNDPPISIRRTKSGKVIHRCHDLNITVPTRIEYNKAKPLPCGAKVWIEISNRYVKPQVEVMEFSNGGVLCLITAGRDNLIFE